MNRNAKPIALFMVLFVLAMVSLACRGDGITDNHKPPRPEPVQAARSIGFDFSNPSPASPEGDISAGSHLFVHRYPIPDDGFITAIAYLNDNDTASESFDLLVLRPDDNGWTVIYRINLADDAAPAQTGMSVVNLPYPLPVQKGDIFAHWQPDAGGAIPVNLDQTSVDGLSAGQFGFESSEIEVGARIEQAGFSGQRDYFINLIFAIKP